MPLTPDRRLQARIVGALALVVGVNGLLIAVLAWSVSHALAASGHPLQPESSLPLTIGTLLVGAVGLVALQARYGTRAVVSGLEVDDTAGDGPRNIDGRVRRLATQADVAHPSVAVADRAEPGCLTVGSQRSPTIVVTTGLLEALDDDELDAALAHEVAHIANRDLPVVTAVAATVAIGDRLLERERRLRRVLWATLWLAVFTGIGIIVLAVPLLVLGSLYLVWSAVARGLLGVNAITLGLFSKAREHAADRGAVQLTGEPAALAAALETLEDERPTRDVRIDASATLGIVAQPLTLETRADDEGDHWVDRWTPKLSPEFTEPDAVDRAVIVVSSWLREHVIAPVTTRVRRLLAWRPQTHPATETRLERLRTLERRRE
ncbi:M56 family metallopeptidase [Natronorubrum sulfidifaciens]|uniref:Peptidase M48 Ste24p n=1 Tax=Natronorubrum sulfidifaciens JCM 14089 TaxID=1230460 RepID=L9W9P3_9EURY|nr:M56 family metallopeptidase [Natronorubrum sulfidifaciens]ELY46082.1 peptidase M48 Ste24p [Natronorubrum sulfidifaciens JCM 14089]